MCELCSPDEALDLCDEIVGVLEDLPEQAEDYAASVEEKVEGIRKWIEENDHVTERQLESLQNMLKGAEKWQR